MDTPAAPDKPLSAERNVVAVVGGGPAGLRAAEVLAQGGCGVVLYEGKASVGRKFLVAGRGGLNLTHSEALETFVTRYGDQTGRWKELLAEFGPAELRAWAASLGVETYVGTSGRVFPRGQQAAILLRRWVTRLRETGVEFRVHRRLTGLRRLLDGAGWNLVFSDPRDEDFHEAVFQNVVLALGGASWPQTGSDGAWPALLRSLGVPVTDWQAANCGFEVAWDPRVLAAAEGLPLKNLAATAGGRTVAGELLITRYGLEGGALYQLGRELRAMSRPSLQIDFKPGTSEETLFQRWPERGKSGQDWGQLARVWRLGPGAIALLKFQGHDDATPGATIHGRTLAAYVKRFPLELRGPRPVAEAISSAGGISWDALDDNLMVRARPGLFVAGEMVDWEAPTGGYLLQGCFATGTRAGQAVLERTVRT